MTVPAPLTSTTLLLPTQVGPDEIDDAVLRTLGGPKVRQAIVLDMSEVAHVEPAALVYLVAALASAKQSKIVAEFSLALPQTPRVRDFLRRWKFGSALTRVLELDSTKDEILTEASQRYRIEDQGNYRHYAPSRRMTPEGDLVELTSKRFFSTRIHRLDELTQSATEFAEEQQEEWDSPDIRAVLESHLGRRANLVAPGVVYEAIMNAAFHPGARTLIVLSHLNEKATKKYRHGLLTISLWDDGHAITETLRAALVEGVPLRTDDFDHYYDWYAIYKARAGTHDDWQAETTRHSAKLEIGDTATDVDLLLASTYPGVSSAHDRSVAHVEAGAMGHGWEKSGMGLYILASIAIDSFGGEVALRSGNGFVNIKRATGYDQRELRCRYRCNSFTTPSRSLAFVGNHITVRIPLLPKRP